MGDGRGTDSRSRGLRQDRNIVWGGGMGWGDGRGTDNRSRGLRQDRNIGWGGEMDVERIAGAGFKTGQEHRMGWGDGVGDGGGCR